MFDFKFDLLLYIFLFSSLCTLWHRLFHPFYSLLLQNSNHTTGLSIRVPLWQAVTLYHSQFIATTDSDMDRTDNDMHWYIIVDYSHKPTVKTYLHCQFVAKCIACFIKKIINFSHEVRLRQILYENYGHQRDLKTCSWKLFNLRWFICPNIKYKSSDWIWDGWQSRMQIKSTLKL